MKTNEYDRTEAKNYAERFALYSNPNYFDYDGIGGDCTNFASQCLFCGCKTMNTAPVLGWYYYSANCKAAAWTGVEFFYNFLINNYKNKIGDGAGPFGTEVEEINLEIGDFAQLSFDGIVFSHTLVLTGFSGRTPLFSAHSSNNLNIPVTFYNFSKIRYIKILGYRR